VWADTEPLLIGWIKTRQEGSTMKSFLYAAIPGTCLILFAVLLQACGGGAQPSQALAPPLAITPASLPSGTAYSQYNQTIQASGGIAPFSWTVTQTYAAEPLEGLRQSQKLRFAEDVTLAHHAEHIEFNQLSIGRHAEPPYKRVGDVWERATYPSLEINLLFASAHSLNNPTVIVALKELHTLQTNRSSKKKCKEVLKPKSE